MNKKRIVRVAHTEDEKYNCVAAYLLGGSMLAVSEACGIPVKTLYRWQKEPWWLEVVAIIKAQQRVELSGKLATVVNKSLGVVEDRLTNGEYVLTKHGDVVKVPVAARTAGELMAKAVDRQLMLEKMVITDPKEKQDSILERLKSIELRLIEASKIGKNTLPVLEGEFITET